MPAAAPARKLPQRFERLEPRGLLGRVKAHAFRGAVIDSNEHRRLSFLDRGRHGVVTGPDFVGPLGEDRARVGILRPRERAGRREQLFVSHQPQHTRLRRAHLLKA